MVGGAGERPAKSFLTSPGFALPDCSPPVERLRPPCLHVLKNSAQSPPRCTGDCPCALAVSASPAQRGQARREHMCAVLLSDKRVWGFL